MANIEVNDTLPRVQYTASSGQTEFTIPWPFFTSSSVLVYQTGAGDNFDETSDLLALSSGYSIVGAGNVAGVERKITLTSAASNGDIITLLRSEPFERTSDYQDSGDLLAETLNDEQDLIVMLAQQLNEGLDRSIRLSPLDTSDTSSFVVPGASARSGKILGFDSSGNLQATNIPTIEQIDGNGVAVSLDLADSIATLSPSSSVTEIRTTRPNNSISAGANAVYHQYVVSSNRQTGTPGQHPDWGYGVIYDADGNGWEISGGEVFAAQYGANPADADSTSELQSMLDHGKPIVVIDGAYNFTLLESADGQWVRGLGWDTSIIKIKDGVEYNNGVNIPTAFGLRPKSGSSFFKYSSFVIDGNYQNSVDYGTGDADRFDSAYSGDTFVVGRYKQGGVMHGDIVIPGETYVPATSGILEDVWSHSNVRSAFLFGSTGGDKIVMRGCRAGDSALDHWLYAEGDDLIIESLVCSGYANFSGMVSAGVEANEISFIELAANPNQNTTRGINWQTQYLIDDRADHQAITASLIRVQGDLSALNDSGNNINRLFRCRADESSFGIVRIDNTHDGDVSDLIIFSREGTPGAPGTLYGMSCDKLIATNMPESTIIYASDYDDFGSIIFGDRIHSFFVTYRSGAASMTSVPHFHFGGSSLSDFCASGSSSNANANSGPGVIFEDATANGIATVRLKDSFFRGTNSSSHFAIIDQNATNGFEGVIMENVRTRNIAPFSANGRDLIKMRNCQFFDGVSESVSIVTLSGDGSTTDFTFNHNLAGTPNFVIISPIVDGNEDHLGNYRIRPFSNVVEIEYEVAPPLGPNNIMFRAECRIGLL